MLSYDLDVIAQLDEEDPLSAKDLAELDRLTDVEDAHALAAILSDPTLTQILAGINPALPSFQDGLDFSGLGGSPPPTGGTIKPAGGNLLGS